MGWVPKLKNALKQIDADYEIIMNSSEKVREGLSIDGWKLFIKQITIACTKTEGEMDRLKQDLYSVLVDKCTQSQASEFENDEKDGFFAYYRLFNKIKNVKTKTPSATFVDDWSESMSRLTKPGQQINKRTEALGFQGSGF